MTDAKSSHLIRSSVMVLAGLCLLLGTMSATAQNRPDKKDDQLLSAEDLALIQVYEVDLQADPPPRVIIARDKLRDFLKEFQQDDRVPRGKQNQERWLRSDGHEQLELLFQLKARSYYEHVRIRSKVQSLSDWGNIHRRYVLGYFQPNFGDGDVKGLYLFPRGRDADRIEMTNFYILTQVAIDGKPIIDRNIPEESLLVQWGLPRDSAKFPAPDDIKGWEPKFKSVDDERFVEHVDWIKSLIAANQGSNYGINYKMPKHKKSNN